jgi:hypothetical protein
MVCRLDFHNATGCTGSGEDGRSLGSNNDVFNKIVLTSLICFGDVLWRPHVLVDIHECLELNPRAY